MIYKVIGLMSGSSLDGLDIVFVEIMEQSGAWHQTILSAECINYNEVWHQKLEDATTLSSKDYLLLHSEYGNFIGKKINEFIADNKIQHQVNFIACHGHTTFHIPKKKMTHQLGDGAAIAAETMLPVITDLRSVDVAFGGEGAPIVPVGEKLLFNNFKYFLNIGGIANISIHLADTVIAFDICAANKVLNMLAEEVNLNFDENGILSSRGCIDENLLVKLNELEYYKITYPKSLANSFGIETVYSLIKSHELKTEDSLRTYVEHICIQIKNSLLAFKQNETQQLFITGGGAFNLFLIERLQETLKEINFKIIIPSPEIAKYKEALIMALLGVLRWREQYTVLASVTGATRNSIGGALWLGTEA